MDKLVNALHYYSTCYYSFVLNANCGDQFYPVLKPRWKGPGLMSNLRVREYPRTINKRRDKVLLRGKVKNARGDLTVLEDYSHLGTSIRGVWFTYQSFRVTPRTNPTAK